MQLDINNKVISILIEADVPKLHINYDVFIGGPNELIRTLKKLGWVLLEGKTKKERVKASLSHIVM